MERATKQDEIHRAVEILEKEHNPKESRKSIKESNILSHNSLSSIGNKNQSYDAEDENLTNLEDTIRFMEEKLFKKSNKSVIKDNFINEEEIK